MKDFWNKRYAEQGMAYGDKPNKFFALQLSKIQAGNILLPAEGEGRNAIHAAKMGWQVSAFDISSEGKYKADLLARNNHVNIDYLVGDIKEIKYEEASFDCIGLIFAHFPPQLKTTYYKILQKYLKPNGIVIFEAFSKSHLKYNSKDPKVGGPKNIDMLFSKEEILEIFNHYEILELSEKEICLNEGLYHNGNSSVIRFVGKKL